MTKGAKKYLIFIVVIVFGVLIDQVSKQIVRNDIPLHERTEYMDGFFTITHVKNDGAFLSLGSTWDPTLRLVVLTIIPGLFLIGLMVYLLRSPKLNLLENLAFALIASGGIGNIIDRILEGEVVDFMIMEAFGWHTGVFNIADMYIMFGIGLFLVSYLKKMRQERKNKAASEEAAS